MRRFFPICVNHEFFSFFFCIFLVLNISFTSWCFVFLSHRLCYLFLNLSLFSSRYSSSLMNYSIIFFNLVIFSYDFFNKVSYKILLSREVLISLFLIIYVCLYFGSFPGRGLIIFLLNSNCSYMILLCHSSASMIFLYKFIVFSLIIFS